MSGLGWAVFGIRFGTMGWYNLVTARIWKVLVVGEGGTIPGKTIGVEPVKANKEGRTPIIAIRSKPTVE